MCCPCVGWWRKSWQTNSSQDAGDALQYGIHQKGRNISTVWALMSSALSMKKHSAHQKNALQILPSCAGKFYGRYESNGTAPRQRQLDQKRIDCSGLKMRLNNCARNFRLQTVQ